MSCVEAQAIAELNVIAFMMGSSLHAKCFINCEDQNLFSQIYTYLFVLFKIILLNILIKIKIY